MSGLIHPRMMETLERNFFPQRCALKQPNKSQNSTGEEVINYSVRTGYESLPCRVGAAGGGQRRGNEQIYLEATHRIVLSGNYPDVAEQWKAEVDGQEYDILYVARSAEEATTRLETRIIR
jgi:hypothetical protein